MPFAIAKSGINAVLGRMRTTANNVANVATTGFKKSRTELSESGAGGVRITNTRQQLSQGVAVSSGQRFDLEIGGQGFFRLDDNGETVYSRSGVFNADREGYLVNNSGQRLTGYAADADGNIGGELGPLRAANDSLPAKATTQVHIDANLDTGSQPVATPFNASDPTTFSHQISTTVNDSLGSEQKLDIYYSKTPNNGEWEVRAYSGGNEVLPATTLQFDGAGKLASPAGGEIAIPAFDPGNGSDPLNIKLNLAETSQLGSDFSVNSLAHDGTTSGKLTSVSIGEDGLVSAQYSNGQSRQLGQVAIANFPSPQNLGLLGATSYAETHGSGAAVVGAPGSGGLGRIQGGALESSNVSLEDELVALKQASYDLKGNAMVIDVADKTLGYLLDEKA